MYNTAVIITAVSYVHAYIAIYIKITIYIRKDRVASLVFCMAVYEEHVIYVPE